MTKDSCANCLFWDVYDGGVHPVELGDCRRRPPRISEELLRRTLPGFSSHDPFDELEANLYVPSVFPVTHVTSWCGEHARKVAVPV